jgi:hypothetical protein
MLEYIVGPQPALQQSRQTALKATIPDKPKISKMEKEKCFVA